jgi:hypothetical protein
MKWEVFNFFLRKISEGVGIKQGYKSYEAFLRSSRDSATFSSPKYSDAISE